MSHAVLDPRVAPTFPRAALSVLQDTQLRKNVAHATDVIQAKRARLVAEKTDWQELRTSAASIRDDVLSNLGTYLQLFEERCTAAGGQVHWAADAAEARTIILDILRQEQAREVIKIKTMTSAEIELNPALESAGIHAIETDLAELILQLGNEEPSHIVVPALHVNRSQVREIFAKNMGLESLTDEPQALTEAARTYLRNKFLTVPTAISGANYLVAETGSVVIVESEGNGRMCLTLPKSLITIAGIEKVVPRFRDLEVMLQILARSATGERMNPYNSLWTGVTPGDGPERFHVVLLDNGRSEILARHVERQTLRCIRCGACQNTCPVYRQTGGHAYGSVYGGPIGAILTPQLMHMEHAQSLPFASSLCGACYEVCPVKINIPEVLLELRGTGGGAGQAQDFTALRPDVHGYAHGEQHLHQRNTFSRCAAPWPRSSKASHWQGWMDSFPAWTRRKVDDDPRPARISRRNLPRMVGSEAEKDSMTAANPSRQLILERIRKATASDEKARNEDMPRSYVRRGKLSENERIDLMAVRLREYDADVVECSIADLPITIAAQLSASGKKAIAAPHGLPAEWRSQNLNWHIDRNLDYAEIEGVEAVVTAASAGIADSGTIVLHHGPQEGRRVLSLLPDWHLCILLASQIVETLPEYFARFPHPPTLATMISGPSATADIEMTRIKGVHGPRFLHVVIVRDAAQTTTGESLSTGEGQAGNP